MEELERAFNVDGVRMWLSARTIASTEDQKGILEQQVDCLNEGRNRSVEIEELRRRLSKTEVEQNALCDSEQFEEAGALDITIQELKDAITRQLEEVSAADRQMEGLAQTLLMLIRD